MTSASPSPVTSPAARTRCRKTWDRSCVPMSQKAGHTRRSWRRRLGHRRRDPKTRTCGPPPGPAPVMMSARPSPFTSAAATRTEPWKAGRTQRSWRARRPGPVPRWEDADGPARPGGPGDDFGDAVAVHITARDEHPARKRRIVGIEAGDLPSTPPPARLKARTCGPPDGPAPVMMSAMPSPFTSAAATWTPPRERRS